VEIAVASNYASYLGVVSEVEADTIWKSTIVDPDLTLTIFTLSKGIFKKAQMLLMKVVAPLFA